jgi:hypothetical protein
MGKFGNEWLKRNKSFDMLLSRVALFADILKSTDVSCKSALEFGSGGV